MFVAWKEDFPRKFAIRFALSYSNDFYWIFCVFWSSVPSSPKDSLWQLWVLFGGGPSFSCPQNPIYGDEDVAVVDVNLPCSYLKDPVFNRVFGYFACRVIDHRRLRSLLSYLIIEKFTAWLHRSAIISLCWFIPLSHQFTATKERGNRRRKRNRRKKLRRKQRRKWRRMTTTVKPTLPTSITKRMRMTTKNKIQRQEEEKEKKLVGLVSVEVS